MKRPRNIDASEFIKALQKYGYQPNRQTGSHIRLQTQQNSLHKITVPKSLKIYFRLSVMSMKKNMQGLWFGFS